MYLDSNGLLDLILTRLHLPQWRKMVAESLSQLQNNQYYYFFFSCRQFTLINSRMQRNFSIKESSFFLPELIGSRCSVWIQLIGGAGCQHPLLSIYCWVQHSKSLDLIQHPQLIRVGGVIYIFFVVLDMLTSSSMSEHRYWCQHFFEKFSELHIDFLVFFGSFAYIF